MTSQILPAGDDFYSRALERIQKFMLVLGAAALITACIFFGRRIGMGFALGATIAYLNFHWLKKVVVGLADRTKHYPRQLSGGQEQRVGIARAIVTDPTLLLCDEPTGDLDRKAGDEILQLLQTLNREQGKTIVMVTHDPHAAERARRTLHLEKGTLMEAFA